MRIFLINVSSSFWKLCHMLRFGLAQTFQRIRALISPWLSVFSFLRPSRLSFLTNHFFLLLPVFPFYSYQPYCLSGFLKKDGQDLRSVLHRICAKPSSRLVFPQNGFPNSFYALLGQLLNRLEASWSLFHNGNDNMSCSKASTFPFLLHYSKTFRTMAYDNQVDFGT